MAAPQYLYGSGSPVTAPVATATAIENGDLVGLASGNTVSAAATTWDTNLATTQAAFALQFLGVSRQRKVANVARVYGNSADNEIVVNTAADYEFDCASANFAVGDLVGPAKDTGNALLSNKVVAVATENLAIGRVVRAGTGITRVQVRCLSAKAPLARQS
jgi:hypothetical protein